ncbi:hypothetical protein [Paraherbaspirillum soli]|uniref:N-acetyltransferase domain-containing protein n=1 Tax=Paraherbaspirillum soli TaxID=631222 RepID=A0ABW0MAV2_9BURK
MKPHQIAALNPSLAIGAAIQSLQPNSHSQGAQAKPEQRMPFTIRVVDDERALRKAVNIRQAAYGRHLPELAEKMGAFEHADLESGVVVLLAESKLDGASLGTMRIQNNRYQPLAVEHSVSLPDWLQGGTLAEATRLGVAGGQVGKVVKTMLFKAFFQYCIAQNIDWMVITARAPLDRQYEALLFQDAFPGQGFMPMRHVGNLPHRVLALEVATAEARWQAAAHPLLGFMCELHHPDLILNQQQKTVDGGMLKSGIRAGNARHEYRS